MSQPANIAIDPYDNLFLTERTKGAVEMPVANIGGGSGTFNLWYLNNQFIYTSGTASALGVDASDNIYNFYNYSTSVCDLQAETAYAAEYSPSIKRVAGGSKCGFSGDGGQARSAEISNKVGQIAFDIAGNLYFSDYGNQRIRRIEASTGIISTIAGTGTAGYGGDGGAATTAPISNPTGVAVDSQGQVYILSSAPTGATTQVVRKVTDIGYWNFGGQLRGTTSSSKVLTVSNTGNSAMTLSAAPVIAGAGPSEFLIDPATTNCVLTVGSTLAAGHSCNIGVKFTPAQAGGRAATLTLLDNTVTGSNVIRLSGTGTLPLPTMAITAPASGASVKKGASVTFAVSVTTTATTKPTGTVTFKVNGANVGSPVTLSSSGTASTTFTQSSAATYSLSATYSGDANYGTVTVSQNLVVTASVKAASTVSVSRGVVASTSCGSPTTFSIRVSSDSKDLPAGTVQLSNGTTMFTPSTLHNGAALLSVGTLSTGYHTFIASYSGDSEHMPANSTPLKVVTIRAVGRSCGVLGSSGAIVSSHGGL